MREALSPVHLVATMCKRWVDQKHHCLAASSDQEVSRMEFRAWYHMIDRVLMFK